MPQPTRRPVSEVHEVQYKKSILLTLPLALLSIIGCGQKSSDATTPASINATNQGSNKSANRPPAQSDYDLNHPQVVIETSMGDITVQLDKEKSPLTVENFLGYIDAGSYNQTVFHHVYKDQAIVAGFYTAGGTPIRTNIEIRNEADNGLKNLRGTIAMNREANIPDSAKSEFFINVADNQALDYRGRTAEEYGYCVFGKVVNGLDIVGQIASVPVGDTDKLDQTPDKPIFIKSIRRIK
jgi:cyclophilin family peptidyl-prolyl cis-trans isomerase